MVSVFCWVCSPQQLSLGIFIKRIIDAHLEGASVITAHRELVLTGGWSLEEAFPRLHAVLKFTHSFMLNIVDVGPDVLVSQLIIDVVSPVHVPRLMSVVENVVCQTLLSNEDFW